ncbi:transglutaminase family protein [Phenylobacterium sp. J367]|uniref:transglutaminase family protein n=1 Tax=Phenylobacterium sp. J367 TaxID=2898435 RepID=UPI0021516557|nr:transglutaminase family protein [Phenylobacterium sp. J367]MCR5879313.1 transglutaminase family protein [Phenylobacterium sp. J367]
MPVVSIRHLTTYRYRKPVSFGEHRMMFRPMESHDQRLLSAEVSISPTPDMLRHVHDVSGATVGVARFNGRAEQLAFESRARLDHRPTAAFELEGEATLAPGEAFAYAPDDLAELSRAIQRRHADPDGAVAAWAQRFVRAAGRTPLLQAMSDMTHAIRGELAYGIRLQGAPQSPIETLETRRGSCRDFAVLMMEGARSLGLAARFASGYVYSASPKAGRKGAGTPTPGPGSICRTAAGPISIRPTGSSATPTSCGWRPSSIPARPCRCTEPGQATPEITSGWTSRWISRSRPLPWRNLHRT